MHGQVQRVAPSGLKPSASPAIAATIGGLATRDMVAMIEFDALRSCRTLAPTASHHAIAPPVISLANWLLRI